MTDKKFDDSNRGALFKNDRKTKDTDRDYSGSINVAGHDYWLSAWIKKSAKGQTFMSLSIQAKDGKPETKTTTTPTKGGFTANADMDDEIPF